MDLSPEHRDLVIRTIFGEAGNEPDAGRAAVAAVIRNRIAAGRYGDNAADVILAPHAFEPWNRADHRARMQALDPNSPTYQKLGAVADGVFSGQTPDPTGGATHFLDRGVVEGRPGGISGIAPWASGEPMARIGTHSFYAPEGRVNVDPSWRPPVTEGPPQTTTMPATTSTALPTGVPQASSVGTGAPLDLTTPSAVGGAPTFGSLSGTSDPSFDANTMKSIQNVYSQMQPQQQQIQPLQINYPQKPRIDLTRLRAAIGKA